MEQQRFWNTLKVLRSLLLLGSLAVVVLGLPGCRLECLGDGATTFDSLRLLPESAQVVAGGSPIRIRVEGQIHCVGQFNDFRWSLEPVLGVIQATNDPNTALYLPPITLDADTDVRVVVRFHGYGQNNTATVTVRVLKPPN